MEIRKSILIEFISSYRFYLGGSWSLPSFIILLLFLLLQYVSLLVTYLFKEKKILLSILLILICTTSLSICGIVTQINTGVKIDYISLNFIKHIMINIFTVLLSVYLIEGMMRNIK